MSKSFRPMMFSQSSRCAMPGCNCEAFAPSSANKGHVRQCERASCKHGWVVHAVSGLPAAVASPASVEPVRFNAVFEVASLVLYATQVVPVQVKILLDRLFSVLSGDEQRKVLDCFGWTKDEYKQGYKIQDESSQWTMCTPDEQLIIFRQFLRFGETRALALDFIDRCVREKFAASASPIPAFPPAPPTASLYPPTAPFAAELQKFFTNGAAAASSAQYMAPFLFAAGLHQQNGHAGGAHGLERLYPPLFPAPHLLSNVPPELKRTPPTMAESNGAESDCEGRPTSGCSDDGIEERRSSSQSVIDDGAQSSIGGKLDSDDLALSPQAYTSENASPILRKSAAAVVGHTLKSSGKSISSSSGRPSTNAAGKKRVQCEACKKTFCDKGALKIHFSAVHLKEQHRCTIFGCNMMFSSRRSRNRHSANPNPKLHTPSYRRNPGVAPPGRVVSPPEAAAEYERNFLASAGSEDEESGDEEEGNGDAVAEAVQSVVQSIARAGPAIFPSHLFQSSIFPVSTQVPETEVSIRSESSSRKRKCVNPTRYGAGSVDEVNDDEAVKENESSAISRLESFTEKMRGNTASVERPFSVASGRSDSPCTVFRSRSATLPTTMPEICSHSQDDVELQSDEGDTSTAATAATRISLSTCRTSAGIIQIPIDEANPRRCTYCKLEYQNHFSVKTHYQNVHLKIPHFCVVPGCKSSFPSKRSRDRHSANRTLHNKLLSTSSSGGATFRRLQPERPPPPPKASSPPLQQPPKASPIAPAVAAFHENLRNLYGMQSAAPFSLPLFPAFSAPFQLAAPSFRGARTPTETDTEGLLNLSSGAKRNKSDGLRGHLVGPASVSPTAQ